MQTPTTDSSAHVPCGTGPACCLSWHSWRRSWWAVWWTRRCRPPPRLPPAPLRLLAQRRQAAQGTWTWTSAGCAAAPRWTRSVGPCRAGRGIAMTHACTHACSMDAPSLSPRRMDYMYSYIPLYWRGKNGRHVSLACKPARPAGLCAFGAAGRSVFEMDFGCLAESTAPLAHMIDAVSF